jgi:hypothetical protein
VKLSDSFSLAEMSVTKEIPFQAQNRQDAIAYEPVLTRVWNDLLRPICALASTPEHEAQINIHSGYRGEELNKAIGGSVTSAHMRGEAADFDIDGHKDEDALKTDLKLIMDSGLCFRQLLIERGCLHISLPGMTLPNGEVAYWDKGNKTIMREAV